MSNNDQETKMKWYHYPAYFFGGAFLANCVPHLVNGISGNPFQSPFSTPPGEGLSSSTINVLWGMLNLLIGYLLITRVGKFDHKRMVHFLLFAVGFVLMAIMLAQTFGKFHGGLL